MRLTIASGSKWVLHDSITSTDSTSVELELSQREGRAMKKWIPNIADPKNVPVPLRISRLVRPIKSTVTKETKLPIRLAQPTA